MPIPSLALVTVLRETADRLESGDAYQWAHFGRCNCGHLVQTVTRLSPAEIHAVASYAYTKRGSNPPNPKPREDLAPKDTGPNEYE